MVKTLSFLLCITLGFVLFAENVRCDKCRRKVPVEPGATCGPQQTMFNEGECLCCYKNKKGNPAIGIGFDLRRPDAAQILSKYNLTLTNVLKDCRLNTNKACLTDAEAKDIFNTISYPQFSKCIDEKFAPGLPPVKREALIDVAFFSCNKLSKWNKLQVPLNNQDWQAAANILKNSNWCKLVGPKRCNSDVACIASETGCTGQTCGTFTPNCTNNPYCDCFKTLNGSCFCSLDFLCDMYPDCTACPPETSVCLVDTACESPKCAPILDVKCPPLQSKADIKDVQNQKLNSVYVHKVRTAILSDFKQYL